MYGWISYTFERLVQTPYLGNVDVLLHAWSEVVARVREPPYSDANPFRPDVSRLDCSGDFVVRCIQQCWSEQPEHRPDFKTIRIRLKPMLHGL